MGHELVAVTPSVSLPAAPPTTSLAPGFRFHPTDEELVRYYLRRKACGKPFRFQAISEIDVYKSEPWDLAGYSSLKTRDLEWYFFSPVDRKYGNGCRLNRATGRGYWKATGKDRPVRHKGQTIGMKKTLVFHDGRAPDGKRTNWVMHEYRLADEELGRAGVVQDAFVLCRIFQKSGLGPPNGDRYAPFVEEEWDDDAALFVPGETEDDMANVDDARVEGNDLEQDTRANRAPLHGSQPQIDSQPLPLICKRERSEDCALNCEADLEPISLFQSKKSKHTTTTTTTTTNNNNNNNNNDPNSSNNYANGSEDSTTTSQDPSAKPTLLEFSLIDWIEPKENHHPATNVCTFDAANLEKSVPPGYLKFISNLENEILNVSMERETLKIEVMRAQAMINVLQSRIDILSKENEDLRRLR